MFAHSSRTKDNSDQNQHAKAMKQISWKHWMEALKDRVSDHSEKSVTIVPQMFRNEKGQCKIHNR